VAARLHALTDDRIGANGLHALRECHRRHDRDDLDAGLPERGHVLAGVPGTGRDDRYVLIEHHLHEFIDVRREEHEVHAEGLAGDGLRSSDLLAQQVRGHMSGTDDAEAAGIADGTCQLGGGRPRHAPLDDGVLYAEQGRQSRVESHVLLSLRPADDRGAPCEAAAESDQGEYVPGVQLGASIQVVHRQRYRGS
jgi:hypothetical protein